MKTLNVDEVQQLVTWPQAVNAMRTAFSSLAEGRVVAPKEFSMGSPAPGDIHVKGAYLHGSKWVVVKLAAAGFPTAGNHGCFLILSAETGALDTFVNDGGWLTEVRTAAAGALSIELLARPDAGRVAIIGTGVQAAFQLEALRATRSVSAVTVAARSTERVRSFAAQHQAQACSSIEEAVDGAEIVVCATSSRTSVLDMVSPGTHVTSIGVDMVGKCEPSAALIASADVVAVDDIAVSRVVGILQHFDAAHAVTIGDLLLQRAPGRTRPDQITLVGLSGLGVQDAAIAELIVAGNL